jgi:hypothetical protein
MRRAALALAALVAVLVGGQALAAPPPWANAKPPKRTTTTAATTTTTTVAPTTTTEPMPITTTTMGGCQAPLTISTDGVYSLGCYESTSPGTPAITIATTQPVTLDRMTIKHRGDAVYAQNTTGTNVTITNSLLVSSGPAGTVEQFAVYLRQPATFTFEHNRLQDGHGVLLAGENVATTLLRVRYNDFVDVNRWGSSSVRSAVQFDKVAAPNGASISWNRIVNHHGRSFTEDVINMYQTNGASGFPIEIDHNLIDGSYGVVGDGTGFTGGGIDLGDSGGSWQISHDNTVVRITHNGIMIPAGSNLEHYANRMVTSGIADDSSRVSSADGNGMTLFDNPVYPGTPSVVSMHDNTGDHRRWNGSAWERAWQWTPACDPAGACTNNTNAGLSLTDDAAWLAEVNDALADWETARVAAGVTVGPQ